MPQNEMEETVRKAAIQIVGKERRRRIDAYSHLRDDDYLDDCDNISKEEAEEMYDEYTTLNHDYLNMVWDIMGLYYSYRSETHAETESLLAAATCVYFKELKRFEQVTIDDFEDEFDVSYNTISNHSSSMREKIL